jgi:hypothetical protein
MAGMSSVLAELQRRKRTGTMMPQHAPVAQKSVSETFPQLTGRRATEAIANSFAPGVSDIAAGKLAWDDFKEGNYLSAGLNAAGVLPFIPALGGTLMGRGARGFNEKAAQEASRLAGMGATPREIWFDVPKNYVMPTGTVLQEFSDKGARINAPWLPDFAKLRAEVDDANGAFEWAKQQRAEGKMTYAEFEPYLQRRLRAENQLKTPPRQDVPNMPLSQFLDHPELYDNYPIIGKMDLSINPHTRGAFHSPSQNLIEIGTKDAESANSLVPVVSHEVTHGIQDIEKLPQGGGPENFSRLFEEKRRLRNQIAADVGAGRDPTQVRQAINALKSANPAAYARASEYDAYRSLYGEQMANAVQKRAGESDEWLRNNFFGDEFTTPVEQTLWKNTDGGIYSPPFALPSLGGYGGEKWTHSSLPFKDLLSEDWVRKVGGR